MNVVFGFIVFFLSYTAFSLRIPVRRVKRAVGEEGVEEGEFAVSLYLERYVFLGPISVGTPLEGDEEQSFIVLFDTGSRDLWIPSTAAHNASCTSCPTNYFDHTKSSTFRITSNEYKISYVDKTYSKGHVAYDTVKIGTIRKQISVRNQAFGLAEEVKFLNGEHFDGVMGLGLRTDSRLPGSPDTFLVNMLRQHEIRPVFGIYFNRRQTDHYAGELIFGGDDEDCVQSDFTAHPVLLNKAKKFSGWNIPCDLVRVEPREGLSIVLSQENLYCLPDSGTTMITGPEEIFEPLNTLIFINTNFLHNKTKYWFYCNKHPDWRSILPVVTFEISGHLYPLAPEDYIDIYKGRATGRDICSSSFRGSKNDDMIVLGQFFMHRYYTRYDLQNRQVHFARARHW